MRMVNLNNRSSAFLTRLTQSFGLVILAAFMSTQLNAQCALACNGSIQVSLDTNCEAEITPALALSDDSDIGSCDYTVTIKDYNDGILMSTDISGGSGNYIFPIVDNTYLGDSLKVEIDDGDPDTAPCWGWMIIEDKLAPTLTCLADLTIDCDADDSMLVGQDETFTLSLDTEVSDDGTCVVFDIAALASMPSPLGIIQTAIMSYSATNATVSAAVITTSAGTHVGVVDPVAGTITYSSLVGVQTTATNLSFPWTIKFTYAAVDGALAHSVDAATLTINSSSYFDVNSGSAVLDNCDDIDITIISDDFIPNACRDIDPNCASYRTIVYTATDASGNSAQECTFNICYEKKTLADITVPASSTMACENFNINNLPGLLLDGAAFEYVGNLCQFNVQFTDNMLPGCSGSMLIDRTWTIVDWCTGDLLQRDQVINVVDDIAPTIVCPLDSMEFVSNDGCLLDLTLEPQGTGPTAALQLDDNCTDNDDLIIEVY